MCFCEEEACWIFCYGKHKFLLRLAWIVLVMTTLIEVSSILAYWYLAPKALDSKPGLKLALILLVAVLLLYFFSILLFYFIILKLSPRQREYISEFTTSSNNRTGNCLASFGPMPYSDGLRRVLPNNASAPLSYRHPSTIDPTNQQDRSVNVRQNTRSKIDFRSFHIPTENLSMNGNRRNDQSCDELAEVLVVPENVAENSAPISKNNKTGVHESSNISRADSGSGTGSTVSTQSETSNIPQNLEGQTCDLASRSQSNLCSCSNIAFQNKPMRLQLEKSYRSDESLASSADGRPNLKPSTNRSNIYSRNTNLTKKRLCFRSESHVNRSITNAGGKTSETSINQNMTSRRSDRNPSIGHDLSSGSETTGSETSKQYKHVSSTITRKTDSFLVKSQPVDGQYRRYAVEKLPTTSNPQTQMLFRAIMKSEELIKQADNIPKTNRVVRSVPVQV